MKSSKPECNICGQAFAFSIVDKAISVLFKNMRENGKGRTILML